MLKTAFRQPITKDYPFGPALMTERFRGKLDIDPEKCTGCRVCQLVCPVPQCVTMVTVGKRRVTDREIDLQKPIFDLYTCISCGLCVDECSFHALTLTKDFEVATLDKESMIMKKALPNGS